MHDNTSPGEFLATLYAGADRGHLCIFTLPDSRATFFPVDQQERAAVYAINARDRRDVYFGLGLQGEIPESGRGTTENVIGIPGLWLDVDVQGPTHKSDRLPPTFEAAEALISRFPLKPTLIVHSGHGLQSHWLFKEVWYFTTPEERQEAAALVQRFQATMQGYAAQQGYMIDSTHDLARVLRLPGTYNRKLEPVPVVIQANNGINYNADDFDKYLADPLPQQQPSRPVSSDGRGRLGRPTLEFVANGAPMGEQRSRAVAAARAYLSAGYAVEQTAAALWRGLQVSPQDPEREPWTYNDALAIARDLSTRPPTTPTPLNVHARVATTYRWRRGHPVLPVLEVGP